MIQNPKIWNDLILQVRFDLLKKKAWHSLILWGLLLLVNLFNLGYRIFYQKWDDWWFIIIEIFAGVWSFIYTLFYLEKCFYLHRNLKLGYVDRSCHLCANNRCYYHHKELLMHEPDYTTIMCGQYMNNNW